MYNNRIRKHKRVYSKNELVTGKQLKDFVKQFNDEELVTGLFINEKNIRDEHTDGFNISESENNFTRKKLTNKQVKQVLQEFHNWDLTNEIGWEKVNIINDRF